MRYWDGQRWGDPPEPAPIEARTVFQRTFLYAFVVAVLTAAGSATAGAPVIGTIIGAFIGIPVGIVVGLIVAAVVTAAAQPPVTAGVYRRRVDILLVVLVAVVAAVAALWIAQRAITGPWPALTMVVIVLVSLLFVRPKLRNFVQPQ